MKKAIILGLLAFGVCCSYIAQEVFNPLFFFTAEGILLILAVTIFFKRANNEQ